MATLHILKGRGVTGAVEIHGELLGVPGGDVDKWRRSLTGRVRENTKIAAPSNKRPRWGHYGPRLKDTIRTRVNPARPTKKGFRFYSGVGAEAPHAMYVDQGTGIFNAEWGGSPYEAKILPPWFQGSPSLYEHTWRPSLNSPTAAPVYIKGQRPQYFMEEGLNRSLWRGVQTIKGSPSSIIRHEAETVFTEMFRFNGNTPVTPAFLAQLDVWRSWRDDAWNTHKIFGEGSAQRGGYERQSAAAARRKEVMARRAQTRDTFRRDKNRTKRRAAEDRRSQARTDASKNLTSAKKSNQKPSAAPKQAAHQQMRAEMAMYLTKNPGFRIQSYNDWGFWRINRKGEREQIPWSYRVIDLL